MKKILEKFLKKSFKIKGGIMTWEDVLKKDAGKKKLKDSKKNQDGKKPKRKVERNIYGNPTRLEDFPEHIKGISLPSSFDPHTDDVDDYLKDPKRWDEKR